MEPERFEIKRPEIPTGLGGEINKEFHDWLLLFEKVKNRVDLVNKEVFLPLKLEKGKKSPLGLFAKSAIPELFKRKSSEQRLETWPGHMRSAILGRVIFKDKQGRFFGLLHKNGWVHLGLNLHNITLDCRICDFDTVRELKNEMSTNEIMRGADKDAAQSCSIDWFVEKLNLPESRHLELAQIFEKGYDSVFSSPQNNS